VRCPDGADPRRGAPKPSPAPKVAGMDTRRPHATVGSAGATAGPHPGHERADRSGHQRSPAVRHPPSSPGRVGHPPQVATTTRHFLARRKPGVQIPSPPPQPDGQLKRWSSASPGPAREAARVHRASRNSGLPLLNPCRIANAICRAGDRPIHQSWTIAQIRQDVRRLQHPAGPGRSAVAPILSRQTGLVAAEFQAIWVDRLY
jgi:hypothetical protein